MNECTGDTKTCKVDECWECGVRDCPHKAIEHYWHDGCPVCYTCKGCEYCDGHTYRESFK